MMTPQEYLDRERKAEHKSEYYNGEMFAMAGAKEAHNLMEQHLRMAQTAQGLERPTERRGSAAASKGRQMRSAPAA